MSLRFQKRIRLFKGLTINLSKTGASVSLGGRGMTVNISKRGTKTTVGLPGTGISYSSFNKADESSTGRETDITQQLNPDQGVPARPKSSVPAVILLVVIIAVLYFLFGRGA